MSERNWECLDNLFVEMAGLPDDPGDVSGFVRRQPRVGDLPPPAATWTLLAMYHYRARVRWARSVLARAAGGPAPDGNRAAAVPGHAGWTCRGADGAVEYRHGPTGEVIRFHPPGDVRSLLVADFLRHAGSHADPPPVLSRFRALHPSGAGVVPSLLWLQGVLAVFLPCDPWHRACPDHGIEDHRFRLTDYRVRRRAVARFLRQWGRADDRLWLAAGVGDWPAAADEAVRLGALDLARFARARADECRRGWAQYLTGRLYDTGPTADTLLAHADAGADVPGVLAAYLETVDDEGGGEASSSDHLAEVVGGVIDRLLTQSPPDRTQALALAARFAPDRVPRIEQAGR